MIPAQLLDKFRVLSLDRVTRIETAWIRLLHVDGSTGERPSLTRQIHRELHTIKGDSAIIGEHALQHLAQRLEDLLKLSEQQGFDVSPELEELITTAIRALATLLRPDDHASGELDLPALHARLDRALA
ncbi:MAG TPA: Hpt domain-containing protein [Kofleriaceae bacterium]|nr:Hpt domain-containing protein [Kofleriaceae bacterium]